ncbi:AraC family transcriptional regulator [Thalassotalea sp. 1_MG-2023]|uniref:AraC family transcriptional regulator n=1 Tax=Thalassotalea sp. 1_MG-2023 TaxID=3062680 RepID=UPI0026E213D7|nr:AraC family transcriptional regulator [Thalassotalea sp. 1_MG-2023]MDO6427215.1 AraC family transcriptional regulator [Thalassotalea sp. 1_MG-2023]
MKATCGKSIPSDSCSWRFAQVDLDSIEFNWHYHPEYEICLTLNSIGSKHVGDHVNYYQQANLVILGPNLPHSWHCRPLKGFKQLTVYVAQIPQQWLDSLVQENPELKILENFLTLTRRGIEFSNEVVAKSTNIFKAMTYADPLERYLLLLELLNLMVKDQHATVLSSSTFSKDYQQSSSVAKLDKVMSYIYQHYTEPLTVENLAELVHMSTNHLHRFFKQRTEHTINQFINQLRIGKACKLLIDSDTQISAISDKCGFNNLSNFNRRFRMLKGATPKEYRKRIKHPTAWCG